MDVPQKESRSGRSDPSSRPGSGRAAQSRRVVLAEMGAHLARCRHPSLSVWESRDGRVSGRSTNAPRPRSQHAATGGIAGSMQRSCLPKRRAPSSVRANNQLRSPMEMTEAGLPIAMEAAQWPTRDRVETPRLENVSLKMVGSRRPPLPYLSPGIGDRSRSRALGPLWRHHMARRPRRTGLTSKTNTDSRRIST